MTTLEIPIAPQYVHWGVWECVREILQNGLDAQDRGHPLTVTWKMRASGPVLQVRNEGASLGRDKLRLGGTDKREDPRQRGQFGEGMKLAWMRLLVLGYDVWIRVQGERWVPRIGASKAFGGEDVLCLDIAPVKDRGDVCVEVRGIEKSDWESIQRRMLDLHPPAEDESVPTSRGRLLLSPDHRGNIYAKGVYVSRLPGTWKYGFDLMYVEVDRDRNVPEMWSVQREIRECFKEAALRGLMPIDRIVQALEGENEESRALESIQFDSGAADTREFCRRVTEHFVAAHGENVCPVTSLHEAEKARQSGLDPLIVSPAIKLVLERELGGLDSRLTRAGLEVLKVYQLDEIDAGALRYLLDLCALLREIDPQWNGVVRIVDFRSEQTLGTFGTSTNDRQTVNLAYRILQDPAGVAATLVHEVAHLYGDDGTLAHRSASERLFGALIAKLYDQRALS